jgi:hypothetical protein
MYILQVIDDSDSNSTGLSYRKFTEWEENSVELSVWDGGVKAGRVLKEVIVHTLQDGNLIVYHYPRYYPHVNSMQTAIKPPLLDLKKEWTKGIDALTRLVADWEQRRIRVYRASYEFSTLPVAKSPDSIPTTIDSPVANSFTHRIITTIPKQSDPKRTARMRQTGRKMKKEKLTDIINRHLFGNKKEP